MPNRPLPDNALVALQVIADSGGREISMNEFTLRMHQRGLDSRDVAGAIRAFNRRGWVEQDGSSLVLTQAAFQIAKAGAPRPRPSRRQTQRRIPSLFA